MNIFYLAQYLALSKHSTLLLPLEKVRKKCWINGPISKPRNSSFMEATVLRQKCHDILDCMLTSGMFFLCRPIWEKNQNWVCFYRHESFSSSCLAFFFSPSLYWITGTQNKQTYMKKMVHGIHFTCYSKNGLDLAFINACLFRNF